MLALSLPLAAWPVVPVVPLVPDGDSNGKITDVWYLRPGFWILSLFVSHRGFTHNLFGVSAVAAGLWILHSAGPSPLWIAACVLLTVPVIFAVLDDNRIAAALSVLLVALSPRLLEAQYYSAFLLSLFVLYVSHMLGDLPTSEGWTVLKLGSFKAHLQLPVAFDAGGFFEKAAVYPALVAAMAFFLYEDRAYWLAKAAAEFSTLPSAWEHFFRTFQ